MTQDRVWKSGNKKSQPKPTWGTGSDIKGLSSEEQGRGRKEDLIVLLLHFMSFISPSKNYLPYKLAPRNNRPFFIRTAFVMHPKRSGSNTE